MRVKNILQLHWQIGKRNNSDDYQSISFLADLRVSPSIDRVPKKIKNVTTKTVSDSNNLAPPIETLYIIT